MTAARRYWVLEQICVLETLVHFLRIAFEHETESELVRLIYRLDEHTNRLRATLRDWYPELTPKSWHDAG
jgi:hypothetical protein